MGRFKQGTFKPLNPHKYIGDANAITYRSSWEFKAMHYFDSHPHIVRWSSEEHIIPYFDPVTRKKRRYFPDFLIQVRKPDGKIENILIEVKPKKETVRPDKPAKITKSYKRALMTWATNEAKWTYAEEWCRQHNTRFQILTEVELGIK